MITQILTPESIKNDLAQFLGVKPSIFFQIYKGPLKQESYYRHLYVYCLWKFTDLSASQIGSLLSCHESIVYSSCKKINELCKQSPSVKEQVIKMEGLFE